MRGGGIGRSLLRSSHFAHVTAQPPPYRRRSSHRTPISMHILPALGFRHRTMGCVFRPSARCRRGARHGVQAHRGASAAHPPQPGRVKPRHYRCLVVVRTYFLSSTLAAGCFYVASIRMHCRLCNVMRLWTATSPTCPSFGSDGSEECLDYATTPPLPPKNQINCMRFDGRR